MTLISPDFVLPTVTEDDMAVASIAWGFTIGFGWLTSWTAVKQTVNIYKRNGRRIFSNAYVWMVWLEIIVCLIFSIICWLYVRGVIPPSFAFYFGIVTLWALQVQFLLQIIINRCALLLLDQKKATYLKAAVATLITAVNISVYTIWIPARLQISEKYVWINEWWDRCEKVIYLLVDGSLNFYFIHIVRSNLVSAGLVKYKTLIISMMSLHNTFVYMQFHPLAYMVKLNIELSMADLIGRIAGDRSCATIYQDAPGGLEQGEDSMQVVDIGSIYRSTQLI